MMRVDFGGGDDVAFFQKGCAGIIRLTRPRVLNSLSQSMTRAIARALESWRDAAGVELVLIEGEGRAFCAGGDVVAVWQALMAGGKTAEAAQSFFAAEYRLNHLIGQFAKPCISFLDGFVMGGGAGLSMHGSHRIATENTLFAMPEAAIGFFPDVGMASILARLDGCFGLYLGLTGAQIKWGDCYQFGLATHAIAASAWPDLRQQLLDEGDISILDDASERVEFETSPAARQLIKQCFSAANIEEIITRLKEHEKETGDFASQVADMLQLRAPTSLKVIHKHMALARYLTLDECLELDYDIACQMLKAPNFREGVRSRLIDKDDKPHWQPDRLADVTQSQLDAYFISG